VWGVDGASKPAAVMRLCGHGGHAPHCLSVIEQGLCGSAAAQEMSRGGGKREPESTERINSFLVIDVNIWRGVAAPDGRSWARVQGCCWRTR
jgi:hypothetical protein